MQMPNYIIAGERRSGTTTLAKLLEQHPEIFMYPVMDTAYFMDDALRGSMTWFEGSVDVGLWAKKHTKEEYAKLFLQATKQHVAIGEKSADYLFLENCHTRIKQYVPDCKIILTFRNPIERAWSHYWNEVGKGREQKSFEKAIELEELRVAQSDYAKAHLTYLSRGFYVNSLTKLYTTFHKNNIKVIILEELISNPQKVLNEVYLFLGVDTTIEIKEKRSSFNKNWTSIPKPFWKKTKALETLENYLNKLVVKGVNGVIKDTYKRRDIITRLESLTRNTKKDFVMKPETRLRLQELYLPYTEKLEKLLDKDLSSWKQ